MIKYSKNIYVLGSKVSWKHFLLKNPRLVIRRSLKEVFEKKKKTIGGLNDPLRQYLKSGAKVIYVFVSLFKKCRIYGVKVFQKISENKYLTNLGKISLVWKFLMKYSKKLQKVYVAWKSLDRIFSKNMFSDQTILQIIFFKTSCLALKKY